VNNANNNNNNTQGSGFDVDNIIISLSVKCKSVIAVILCFKIFVTGFDCEAENLSSLYKIIKLLR
jgi:hypothetical protein